VVVVADCLNHRLSLWRLGDGTVWKHLGSKGTEPGQFNYPKAVAWAPPCIAWPCTRARTRSSSQTSTTTVWWRCHGLLRYVVTDCVVYTLPVFRWLYLPYHVFCFVHSIQCGLLDARAFRSQGAQSGQLNGLRGVAVTSKGDVWVADTYNHRLVVLR
jgi:hypothetical protein